jgi:NAD(P)-dependent dehydrogenase (short-subunit alcohol dehydrogenase family)
MPATSFDFGGKVALVTGVGRAGQIGNAVALAFGKAGARIVACDLNAVGVAERVREFAALGVDARPCAGDLTHPDIAALAVETALRHFGRLDVVVNVAGGLTTYGPIERLTLQDIDREVAINLKTTVLVSQAAIPALTETAGCIINFASIAYFEPQSPMAVYSAAKAAVAGFTRSLALELADRKVRVNAVAPGMARTTDNVAAVGAGAAYVELDDLTRGVLALAMDGPGAPTGEIRPIAPGGRPGAG